MHFRNNVTMKRLHVVHVSWLFVLVLALMASCRHPEPKPLPTIDIESGDIPYYQKVPCTMTYTDGDFQVVDEGKIKCRGGYSSGFPKHSYSLKLEHSISLAGLPEQRAWILNANYIDKTMMRHKVCFDLFREMNPDKNLASQCAYVNVTMRGRYYGLFVLMQKLNAGSLGLNKKDSLAVIYKDPPVFYGENRLSHVQEPGNYFQQNYPDIEDEDRNFYLEEVMQFMVHADDSVFASEIGNVFDIDNVIDWQLLIMFVNNGDGVMKNFYLYKRDSDTPFRIAIWDYDDSFGRDGEGELKMLKSLPNFDRCLLINRLQNNPYLNYNERLQQRYHELRDSGLFSKAHVEQMMKENHQIIQLEVARNFEKWPVDGQGYYDAYTYEEELQVMREYLDIAIPELDKKMGYTPK